MKSIPVCPEGHGLLEGRGVLVTAAAGSGIGSAVARRCIEEGARVFVSDAHAGRLERAVAEFSELAGAPVPYAVCDVTRQEDVDALFRSATQALGTICVLVNNAGLGGDAAIVEMSDEAWNRVIDVSLTGTFRCTRAALAHMEEVGRGAIVNNASVLGWRAQARQSHYSAAKAGVMAFTRSAAIEAAPHNIRVNAVAPSLAMHANLARSVPAELLAELESREAFGRAAEPWEVANVVIFLASDYASYLTGEVISVSSQHP